MHIGSHHFQNNLALAPMAGVTDRPFRQLCRRLGAGWAVSEMVASNPALRNTEKSLKRRDHSGEAGPRIVQIVGTEPAQMADAARFNADEGADVIDINMGCPAKKVCKKLAGSALMADEALVARLLAATVNSVDIPVTLKMRTGTTWERRNAVSIARLAEQLGIQAVAVHGRTRDQAYKGVAEYDTITAVKRAVNIPVIANGDIDSPLKARAVLRHTGADALMIGRAAQGNPWIFGQIERFLTTGELLAPPHPSTQIAQLLEHVDALYDFYGPAKGVRIARKHIGWYLQDLEVSREQQHSMLTTDNPDQQRTLIQAVLAEAPARAKPTLPPTQELAA